VETIVNAKRLAKNSLLICIFILSANTGILAAAELIPDQKEAEDKEKLLEQRDSPISPYNFFELSLASGYRHDSLNWNVAGSSVNILSELKWENLEIAQISAAAKFNFNAEWGLRGMLDYGNIYSGSNQDSDYNGNNRTLEFSRSNNKAGGTVRDASIGLGRTIRLLDKVGDVFLSVTALAGLSIHQQNLTMTDGVQTLPASGPFPGLSSSYEAQWQGPWVGMDVLLHTGERLSLTATAEYHWADYSAHANWNLRPEFSHPVSFAHDAKGQGVLLAAGATYLVRKDWSASIAVEVQQWNTAAGIDRTYFSDGSVAYSPLNGVHWESRAFHLGMLHRF
jgi:Protochlamydia outer membrane protein